MYVEISLSVNGAFTSSWLPANQARSQTTDVCGTIREQMPAHPVGGH